jgi:hypothetical protein
MNSQDRQLPTVCTPKVRSLEQAHGEGAQRREDWTMAEASKPLEASRRIEAPAALIFEILANP